ncbi:MAG TPA: DUF2213 domain-containing protein [Pyrinomonadaceae bacterium]|nr:DUF2213 domain-containing protein [Pyrinomonadaceae bacterium]
MPTCKAAGIAYFNNGCVLLLKRSPTAEFGGTWALPAGHVERGESPESAAIRELQEETGCNYLGPLEPIGEQGGAFQAFKANGPYFDVQLNAEHTGAMWSPIIDLPQPLHPGLAELLVSVGFDKLEPIRDRNGFVTRPRTPLSRAGVFPYLGKSIGAPPERANDVFMVFRPPEEFTPETLKSFCLVPIIDEHLLLGNDATPAEEKGVHGTTGDDIAFDPLTLIMHGTTKVFSVSLDALTRNGKKELSCGFKCRYEFTPGVWNVTGERYDVIQRDLRGNHVALTQTGRMGPEFSMYDHQEHFAFDEKEYTNMADPDKNGEGEGGGGADPTLKDVLTMLTSWGPMLAKIQDALGGIAGGKPATPAAAVDGATTPPGAATGGENPPPAMDSAEFKKLQQQVAELTAKNAELEARPTFDSADFLKMLSARDTLAGSLSHHIGTFDHSEMSLQRVAEYGVEKLKIPATKGQEVAAVTAYLHGREAPVFAGDAADSTKQGDNAVTAYVSGKKE